MTSVFPINVEYLDHSYILLSTHKRFLVLFLFIFIFAKFSHNISVSLTELLLILFYSFSLSELIMKMITPLSLKLDLVAVVCANLLCLVLFQLQCFMGSHLHCDRFCPNVIPECLSFIHS